MKYFAILMMAFLLLVGPIMADRPDRPDRSDRRHDRIDNNDDDEDSQRADRRHREDRREDRRQNKFELDQNGEELVIESDRRQQIAGGVRDSYRLKITTKDEDRLEVNYRVSQKSHLPSPPPQVTPNSNDENETDDDSEDNNDDNNEDNGVVDSHTDHGRNVDFNFFRFRLRWFKIIEYIDQANTNGDVQDGYQPDVDKLCKETPLVASDFKITDDGTVVTSNNITVRSYTVNNPTNPLFSFTVHLSTGDGSFIMDGNDISPTSVKIDVDLDTTSYSWGSASCPSGTDTANKLAIEVFLKSKSVEHQQAKTNANINFGSYASDAAAASGFFTWVNTASVTNADNSATTVNVITTDLTTVTDENDLGHQDDDGHREDEDHVVRSFFSFNTERPQTIFWDPLIGYSVNAINSATNYQPMSLLLLTLAALITFVQRFY